MPAEKFDDIITPVEMDQVLKYKLVSWYSLPSNVLTFVIFRVSALLHFICIGTMHILLSLVFWNF
jgi:hypothetical protein